jgi:hypothetical protein
MAKTDDAVWFEFVESKAFFNQIRELSEILTNIQFALIQDPDRGDIVIGTHGCQKSPSRRSSFVVWKEWQLSLLVSLSRTRRQDSPAVLV